MPKLLLLLPLAAALFGASQGQNTDLGSDSAVLIISGYYSDGTTTMPIQPSVEIFGCDGENSYYVDDFPHDGAFYTGGLYLEDDASLRLYGAIPKILGTRATLEMYLQGREFSETDDFGDEIETSEIESSLQLAYPLAERLKGRIYLRFNDRVVTAPDPFFPDLEFSIQRSNLINNEADQNGGAIYNQASMIVESTSISGNNAAQNGGGIYHNGNMIFLQHPFSIGCMLRHKIPPIIPIGIPKYHQR